MKIRNLVLVIFAVIVSWMIELQFNTGYSNETGAPAAVTGSPGDNGKTCAKSGCHTGFAVVVTPNIITSNIPVTGYVPGTTYTITATCAQTGINKWGFEISPQDNAGNLLGQPIITNAAQTKIKSTKYVTQTTSGSSGTGTKTWSFNWLAPAAGTGDVTYYGSFNYANNNGGDSGDHIHTSTLVVNENTGTTGIADADIPKQQLEVWPNPVRDQFSVKLFLPKSCRLKIILTGMDGKLSEVLTEEDVSDGFYTKQFKMHGFVSAGSYFITVTAGQDVMVKKIIVLKQD